MSPRPLLSTRSLVPASSLTILMLALAVAGPAVTEATPGPILPGDDVPRYLRDRGTGVATSLFGTYVRRGEFLVYPFFEYTKNSDQEYKPSELGFSGDHDYRAQEVEREDLLFVSYGFSDKVALEVESALHTSATQHKAGADPSTLPSRLNEAGFGDTQAELRWRWWDENARRPELWSYFEVVFPFQRNRVLIGTQDWEIIQGLGVTRGFGFGTLTGRVSASYTAEDQSVIFGEYALEYLKRWSPHWRTVLAVEGEQDEVAGIAELQWALTPTALLKLNNGFGLTSKAPDVAPEVGIAFSF